MTFAPGDRVTVTMPRAASREGEYVEDRGTRCRVLLDGEHVTRIVLRERVRAAPAVLPPLAAAVRRGKAWTSVAQASGVWVSERVGNAFVTPEGALVEVEVPPHMEVTGIDHETRTISVGLRAVPKPPKPWRSEAYRVFVRDRSECACCGHLAGWDDDSSMEAHHHGPHAMSQKAGDEKCIPLLRRCHRYFHDHGTFRDMDRAETDRVALASQAECLTEWCKRADMDADAIIVTALINHIRESQT